MLIPLFRMLSNRYFLLVLKTLGQKQFQAYGNTSEVVLPLGICPTVYLRILKD